MRKNQLKIKDDKGASEDDEIHEAYAAMDKIRKTYRDQEEALRHAEEQRVLSR